jgi:hypothetical protein
VDAELQHLYPHILLQHLRTTSMESQTDVVVVPWYREDHYPEVLSVMEDATSLPDRYEWWHQGASEQVASLRRRGARSTAVAIDPRLFLSWCSEHDLLPNAEARVEYARELASHYPPIGSRG